MSMGCARWAPGILLLLSLFSLSTSTDSEECSTDDIFIEDVTPHHQDQSSFIQVGVAKQDATKAVLASHEGRKARKEKEGRLGPPWASATASIDLSLYKEDKGAFNLYTDPYNDRDLIIDITNLMPEGLGNAGASRAIMVTGMFSRGAYYDDDGQVLPSHEPLEYTENTVFGFEVSPDGYSVDLLQPQLNRRTSDDQSVRSLFDSNGRPWAASLIRLNVAGLDGKPMDRVVLDGIELIARGFFVMPLGMIPESYRIVKVASYEQNCDVTIEFIDEAFFGGLHGTLTWSLVVLPDPPMPQRAADDRLGYFTVEYRDLGIHKASTQNMTSQPVFYGPGSVTTGLDTVPATAGSPLADFVEGGEDSGGTPQSSGQSAKNEKHKPARPDTVLGGMMKSKGAGKLETPPKETQAERIIDEIDSLVSVIWRYNIERLPDKQIKFYVDPTVPKRWRPAFKEGIEAWNDAFSLAGYPNGIRAVVPEDEDWPKDYDVGDVRFNTITWAINDDVYSIGVAKVDPRSGEIMKTDIVMSDGWIRAYLSDLDWMAPEVTTNLVHGWRRERREARGAIGKHPGHPGHDVPAHRGLGRNRGAAGAARAASAPEPRSPADVANAARAPERRRGTSRTPSWLSLLGAGDAKGAAKGGFAKEIARLQSLAMADTDWEDIVMAGLREVVMHETGHGLGLRHNFKGSVGVSYECLQDMACTAKQSTTASVMDYNPINLPKGRFKGVHAFAPVVGAYDKLAIQYGYSKASDFEGPTNVPHELQQVLENASNYQSCSDMEHQLGEDPLCEMYDLSSTPLAYYEDQVELVRQRQKTLFNHAVKPGEPYADYGDLMLSLSYTLDSVASALVYWIGGINLTRAHRGFTGLHLGQIGKQSISAEDQMRAMTLMLETLRPAANGLTPPMENRKFVVVNGPDGIVNEDLQHETRYRQKEILKRVLSSGRLIQASGTAEIGGPPLDALPLGPLATVFNETLGSGSAEDWDLQAFYVARLTSLLNETDPEEPTELVLPSDVAAQVTAAKATAFDTVALALEQARAPLSEETSLVQTKSRDFLVAHLQRLSKALESGYEGQVLTATQKSGAPRVLTGALSVAVAAFVAIAVAEVNVVL